MGFNNQIPGEYRMKLAAGSLYVRNYGSMEDKALVSQMTEYIKNGLVQTIESTAGKDDATKEQMKQKVRRLNSDL